MRGFVLGGKRGNQRAQLGFLFTREVMVEQDFFGLLGHLRSSSTPRLVRRIWYQFVCAQDRCPIRGI